MVPHASAAAAAGDRAQRRDDAPPAPAAAAPAVANPARQQLLARIEQLENLCQSFADSHKPSARPPNRFDPADAFTGPFAALRGTHLGFPAIDLESKLEELMATCDDDGKAEEILVIFKEVHEALITSTSPAKRLTKLLESGSFRVTGQQVSGKIALAVLNWRKRHGLPSVLTGD